MPHPQVVRYAGLRAAHEIGVIPGSDDKVLRAKLQQRRLADNRPAGEAEE